MDHFNYHDNILFVESVSVAELAAQYGTPSYIYSRATLEQHWHAFDSALSSLDHMVCYAVKANSNIAILNLFARLGSGFDIVSLGELERVIAAGADPKKIVFSGVAKRVDEMQRALELGIHCFNVESEAELYRLNDVANDMDVVAPVSIRVNPDVDAQTHPYISTGLKENKFGIPINQAKSLYLRAKDLNGISIQGIDCHIGSQLTQLDPFVDALQRVLKLIDELAKNDITINHIDIGGGLGIRYQDETPPLPAEYAQRIVSILAGRNLKILIEPGRAIAGNAGILVTKTEYLKKNGDKHFAIVDAAMNDLMRPALYQAWQEIIPICPSTTNQEQNYDVVGPICETGDFLGQDRKLNIAQGDLLAVRSAGAYGFSMSSNYNSRPRAIELLVDGEDVHVIRERETIKELYALEHCLPD